MFTRLRSSTAAFAALIAVACAPTPVMAGDPDTRHEMCVSTVEITLDALLIAQDDRAKQDEFIAWFNGLPPKVQVFLAHYFQLGILVYHHTGSMERVGQELFAVCMERRA